MRILMDAENRLRNDVHEINKCFLNPAETWELARADRIKKIRAIIKSQRHE